MAKSIIPHSGPIVTRADAMTLGRIRYFTGLPCKRGHISERLISTYQCLECLRERAIRVYWENPEKYRAMMLESRRRHLEKRVAYNRVWKSINCVRVLEKNKEWRERNPEAFRAIVVNRRARLSSANGRHTSSEIKTLLSKQKYKCGYCQKSIKSGYHVDHIIPLSKGGTNWIRNIQILCAKCNMRKHDKNPLVFAREMGKLL